MTRNPATYARRQSTPMLERLQRLAHAVSGLSTPSLLLACGFLAYATYVVVTSSSHADDKYLFPSILGFLWALSFYGFVETFRFVPEPLAAKASFMQRLKRRLARLWYGMIAIAFLGTTAAFVVLSIRVLSVWFSEYGAKEN